MNTVTENAFRVRTMDKLAKPEKEIEILPEFLQLFQDPLNELGDI